MGTRYNIASDWEAEIKSRALKGLFFQRLVSSAIIVGVIALILLITLPNDESGGLVTLGSLVAAILTAWGIFSIFPGLKDVFAPPYGHYVDVTSKIIEEMTIPSHTKEKLQYAAYSEMGGLANGKRVSQEKADQVLRKACEELTTIWLSGDP